MRERGFSLVETVVTVGILAILLAAGGIWMLGMHPGALAQATDDYDAALASARALAATSGNGATLAFLPRTLGGRTVPGFSLRVYSGRPSVANAVSATNAMPVVSDAAIAEAGLGAPPFAIFIGASGQVSGRSAYPAVDALGNAAFPAIVSEPACPPGGFTLTFTSPQGATQTRMLPCIAALAGTPGPPNPSPTPNVPIVTPTGVVFHWPADAQQTVVATEWGYTHWFAAAGFRCGAGIATFPDDLPKPYSPPYDAAEGAASPAPPPGVPFSYPNSGGASMEDAPAPFPLDPAAAGLCNATVSDEFAQKASAAVQVMGWLTATYGGVAYTHVSSSTLSLPSSSLPKKGASVVLPISKSYDAEPLQVQVAFDAACSPYVSYAAAATSTPASPSATPAKAALTLSLVSVPSSPITCGGIIYDQYVGSERGEGIPFNATLGGSACGFATCYAQLTASSQADVWGCDPSTPETCSGGVMLGTDLHQLQWWYSTTDGTTWSIVGSCGANEQIIEDRRGLPPTVNYEVITISTYGCSAGTTTPVEAPVTGGTPTPPPWLPANVSWTYGDYNYATCIAVGGLAGCTTPPGWPKTTVTWAPVEPADPPPIPVVVGEP